MIFLGGVVILINNLSKTFPKTIYFLIKLLSITYSPYNTILSHPIGLICSNKDKSISSGISFSLIMRPISLACQYTTLAVAACFQKRLGSLS